MPFKSPKYQPGHFRRVEEILPDQAIDTPVWCVQKAEPWRRKKTIFATCPGCLKINRLDRRRICDSGIFSGDGCFVCPSCRCPFWPHLVGWDLKVRDIPRKVKLK